jgi:peptidoglycan/LPS O-acetylase OafA/YrhL
MLQALLPPELAINIPAWSITVEFAAYIAFPLIAIMLAHLKGGQVYVMLFVLVVFGTAALVLGASVLTRLPGDFGEVTTHGWGPWLRIAVEFPTGCMTYLVWRRQRTAVRGRASEPIAAIGLAGLAVIACIFGESAWLFLTLPFIVCTIGGLASASGAIGKLLGSRLPHWGGLISYSVYMTHLFVVRLAQNLLPIDTYAAQPIPLRIGVVVLIVAFIIAVGAIAYHVVEEPCRKAIRRSVTPKPIPQI